jgi:4-hydroxybenzoyl-CoA thioesterase
VARCRARKRTASAYSRRVFRFSQPVRFADIDHAGIVYYPRFFHYFHLAFEELWRQRIGPAAYSQIIDKDRVGFPAVRAECDFKQPLKFGDTADIEVTVPRLGTKSITFRYRIFRSGDHALCAEGQVVCAVVDLARFVAVAIPDQVSQMLRDLVET